MFDRIPMIAGNWKMNLRFAEAVELVKTIAGGIEGLEGVDVLVAPPFTHLAQVRQALGTTKIFLAGQNMHSEMSGAYTGEISGTMIVSAGCSHVIIGHSERRQYFNETDATVNQRIVAAIRHKLVPVFCVGETEAQREADATFSVLDKQVTDGLQGIASEDLVDLVIAYEPVWAIGTGKTATSEQAQEVHQFLRGQLAKAYGAEFAQSVRILYGGSVKPANIAELMSMADVDGALVGGASLEAETFSQIVKF